MKEPSPIERALIAFYFHGALKAIVAMNLPPETCLRFLTRDIARCARALEIYDETTAPHMECIHQAEREID